MKNKMEKLIICMILLALVSSFSIDSSLMKGINTNVEDFSFSVSNLSTQDSFWPPNSSDWTEVAPETQGLDSDKISDMYEYIEKYSLDIHSVIIVRNGYLLTEQYLYNSQLLENKSYYGGETLHMQQSTTKSLISILIGIALQEGFLDNLNQTLYEFFADIWEPSFVDSELKKNITIEQLLMHNSGLGDSPSYLLIEIDCIKYALELISLEFTPGEEGEAYYSNDGVNLLSGIITNVTGKSTEEFAQEYLFTPLGISEDEYNWWYDNQGMRYGGYGFDCTPKVQAKLGMLCLNNGTWNGTQIVDKDYMKDATSNIWDYYGYLFYTTHFYFDPYDGYYTYGAGGQCIYVLPEYNMTVAFTGGADMNHNNILENYIIQFAADNPPDWDQMPEDQIIQEGDSLFYDVNASDASGVAYSINNTVNFNITPEGIITNTSSLSLGVYPLEIRAYNSFNNSITATIHIRVEPKSINNGIPGFELNMILIMILWTSAVIIIRRKKIFKK
jgi:CubicO group peptidase (beta-lactamase class C family)